MKQLYGDILFGIGVIIIGVLLILVSTLANGKPKFEKAYHNAIETDNEKTFNNEIKEMIKHSKSSFDKYLNAILDKLNTDKYNLTEAQNDLIYRVSRHTETYSDDSSMCLGLSAVLVLIFGAFVIWITIEEYRTGGYRK